MAILVVVGAAASYYFARSAGRAGNRLYLLVAAGLIVPFQIGVLPLYRLFTQLGLAGNPVSVILFNAGIQLPLTVLLYTGFMRQLPVEYEEAARVDGATSWQAFRRVVVPLLLPVTGTVVILDGIAIWNEFFTPLLYLGGTGNVTLPVQIYNFAGEYGAGLGSHLRGPAAGQHPGADRVLRLPALHDPQLRQRAEGVTAVTSSGSPETLGEKIARMTTDGVASADQPVAPRISGVQSVERAFEILERIAAAGGEASLSDLAAQTSLPLPTIHRMLRTLSAIGYVIQSANRRYMLGPGLIRLGRWRTTGSACSPAPSSLGSSRRSGRRRTWPCSTST